MTTIKIKEQNAKTAWESADAHGQKMLENLFPDVEFKPLLITDRVKTLADAIAIVKPLGNTLTLLQYNGVDPFMLGAQAMAELSVIATALNEGWEANWADGDQRKYYPWFEHKSGVGLSYGGYLYGVSHAGVGSRLCYKTSDLATYAGKQFQSIYQKFLQK